MSALEKSMIDMAANFSLCHLSIDYNTMDDHAFFSTSMQWREPAGTYERDCVLTNGQTIGEALEKAFKALAEKRGAANRIADEALPEVAA